MRRFLSERMFSNQVRADKYFKMFKVLSFDDIRLLEHMDEQVLTQDIGIKKRVYIKMFLKRIEKFRVDCKEVRCCRY